MNTRPIKTVEELLLDYPNHTLLSMTGYWLKNKSNNCLDNIESINFAENSLKINNMWYYIEELHEIYTYMNNFPLEILD